MSELIRFGESVFPYLVNAVWKGTALMVIVFAVARILGRRRLVARYWVWVYCMVGLLLLPVTSLIARGHRLALLPARERATVGRVLSWSKPPSGLIDPLPAGKLTDRVTPSQAATTLPLAEKAASEAQTSSMAPHSRAQLPPDQALSKGDSALPWQGWISLAWLAGCAVFLSRLLFAGICVVRLRRSSSPIGDSSISELFEAAKKSAGVRTRAKLRTGKNVSSPVFVGMARPTILLPESLVREMPLEQLRPILLHELAHIRWGDYAVNILQRIAEAVFFFHPLVWLVNRRLRSLREEICDNWVVDWSRDGVLYAKALTELAGRSICPRPSRLATLGLFSHCPRIRRRIERILSSEKRPAVTFGLKTAVGLLSISLAMVGFLSVTSLSARAVERTEKVAMKKAESPPLAIAAEEEAKPAAATKFGKKAVVSADGSGDTRSVQEAIDGVDENGTVSIKPGTYRELLTISKAVTVEGAGRDVTLIEATGEKKGDRWVAVSIQSCKDVSLKGLTIASGTRISEQSGLVLVAAQDADVSVEECSLLWAQYGIAVSSNSNARIEKCLVAGIWGTGIAIGRDASATVTNCEVRNCYHRCITVRSDGDVRIENNLISGSAWHGIRYDHCSPTIMGNVLNNHARFGIYASGSGEAKIINNLFLRNDMSGVSTWGRTNPLVRNNTFVENKRGGLEMDVTTRPVVENNIFFGEETAASRFYTSSSRQSADSSPPPELSHNLLCKNKNETPPPPRPKEEIIAEYKAQLAQLELELADMKTKYTDAHPEVAAKKRQIEMLKSILKRTEEAAAYKPPELSFSETALRDDPLFVDANADNYNLRPDSPARGAGKDGADIGAKLTISVKLQYPITPEEKLIIPDSDSRDFKLWKKGTASPPVRGAERKPAVAAAPTAEAAAPAGPPLEELPGKLIFEGTYNHRSRARPYGTSKQWIKQREDGATTAVTELRSTTYIASGSNDHRLTEYKLVSKERGGFEWVLTFQEGKVTTTKRTPGKEDEVSEISVPEGFLFDPNSRPDPYCAAHILLRGFALKEGEAKEVNAYDWDNSGKGMATYTFKIENTGKQEVTVPAGTFEANHLVLTQLSTGDTWYKKRAGHVTDFWVLDNEVIVRILRHREPYELLLANYKTPSPLLGLKERAEASIPPESDVTKPIWAIRYADEVYCVAFTPDGKGILAGSADGTLKLWDVESGEEIRAYPGHAGKVASVVFSSDGNQIVTGSWDMTAKLWDAATAEVIRTFSGHTDCVEQADLSPDRTKVATASWDGTAKLWNAATGEEIRTLSGHTRTLDWAEFSPDGTKLVTAGYDGIVRLWGVETGEEIRTFSGHSGPVHSARFSRDGKKLLTASTDSTAKLWNVETGELIRTFSGHSTTVWSVAFSPDDTKIATGGSYERTAKVWDVATGKEIRTFAGHNGNVDQVAFSPDGRKLATACHDKTLRLWDMGPVSVAVKAEAAAPAAIVKVTRPAGVTEVIIDVTKGGKFVLDRVEKSIEEISEMLQQIAKERPDARVIVRAHRESPYKNILEVLDACKKANLSNVSLALTDKEHEGEKRQPASPPPTKAKAEQYLPPDYEGYFPDDPEGARKLDALGESGISQSTLPDEEILEIVRRGLRRTTNRWILRALGNRYIWGKYPQNPKAIEIMYHATGGPDMSNAVYFGLSVVIDKSPSILRTLVDICMRSDDPNVLSRVAWGAKSQRGEILPYMAPYLNSADEATQEKARIVEKILKGELKAFAWATEKARVRAEAKFTDKLLEIKEKLLHGDSVTRREVLELIGRNAITLIMDDSFIEAWKACAADPDARIRNEVARTFGGHWIWSAPEQKPEAIDLILQLSKDEVREVRYNSVYFGLSTVRDKSEAVVKRLLEIALEDREWNMFSRIQWGLRGSRDLAAKILEGYMDQYKTDHKLASAAFSIYKDIVGKPAPHPERFQVVYVQGQVNKPGQFSFSGEEKMTLYRAIMKAGGFTHIARKKVMLITTDDAGKERRVEVDVSGILKKPELDPPVKAGDIIFVPESIP